MPRLSMETYLRRVLRIQEARVVEQDEHIRTLESKIRNQKDSLRRLHIALHTATETRT